VLNQSLLNTCRKPAFASLANHLTFIWKIPYLCQPQEKLQIRYCNAEKIETERVILPVALTYYIEVAVVSAWCELREDYRHFRADRVLDCRQTENYFHGRGALLRQHLAIITPD